MPKTSRLIAFTLGGAVLGTMFLMAPAIWVFDKVFQYHNGPMPGAVFGALLGVGTELFIRGTEGGFRIRSRDLIVLVSLVAMVIGMLTVAIRLARI
jgi:hypothetical protein